jgi:NAD+-dependent secondary alcohol dehydrogenase Adh1
VNLTRRAGSHYIIGYGGTVKIATIDIISSERNIDGSATWSAPTTWSS